MANVAAAVAVVAFLATVAQGLIGRLVRPLLERFGIDCFWLQYVAWAGAGVLAFLSGVNLFAEFIPAYPLVGRILTALVAGCGADWLQELFSMVQARRQYAEQQGRVMGEIDRVRLGLENAHLNQKPRPMSVTGTDVVRVRK